MSNTISLTMIEKIVVKCAHHIRRAEEGFSGESFTSFIDHLIEYSDQNRLSKNETIANITQVMSQAQQRNDMLFVADIMQYELVPYLQQLAQKEASNE